MTYSLANYDGTLQNLDQYITGVWMQTSEGVANGEIYNAIDCTELFTREEVDEVFYS